MTEEVSKEQIKGENGTGIDEAKRLKEKKGANMVVKILAIVLVPLIAIAVIAILALNSAGDRISDAMMKHELAADGICTGNEPEQFRSRRLFIRERSTL